MARTILVTGNDGSGKSTFTGRYAAKLEARGLRVARRHYYCSVVRSLLRGVIERRVRVSQRKRGAAGEAEPVTHCNEGGEPRRRGMKTLALLVLLYGYQTCMAIEWRLRDWLCRADVLLTDRGFVDDLVSIVVTVEIEPPTALVKWSARLFPLRRVIYLSAGHEVEYARIVDVDLIPEVHRRKGEHYAAFVGILESQGVCVRRLDTAPRSVPKHSPSPQARTTTA